MRRAGTERGAVGRSVAPDGGVHGFTVDATEQIDQLVVGQIEVGVGWKLFAWHAGTVCHALLI
jgi:hypothetical protein